MGDLVAIALGESLGPLHGGGEIAFDGGIIDGLVEVAQVPGHAGGAIFLGGCAHGFSLSNPRLAATR